MYFRDAPANPYLKSSAFRLLLAVGLGLIPNLLSATVTYAQKGDSFEGAVWRFHITPMGPKREPVTGVFRVADDVLFQKGSRDDKEKEKQIGKNYPDGRKTRMVFKEMLVFEKGSPSGQKEKNRMSGVARLRMDERGEWSGDFVDSDGVHWDFRCSRVRE